MSTTRPGVLTRNPVYQSAGRSEERPYEYDPTYEEAKDPAPSEDKPAYLLDEAALRQKLAEVDSILKNQNQAGNPQLIAKRIQYKFLLGYILRKGYYGSVINEVESQQYLKAAAEEEAEFRASKYGYPTAAGSLALGLACDETASEQKWQHYQGALLCPNPEEMEPVIHCFLGNFLYNHSELATSHSTVTLFGGPVGTTTKIYDQKKLNEAVAHFKKSAEAGFVFAQDCLGYNRMWPQGKDISSLVSVEQAFNYLKQAATEGGCASAMSSMGNVYAVGTPQEGGSGKRFINKDLKKARHWYEAALKQNYSNAQIGLDKIRPASCCTIS